MRVGMEMDGWVLLFLHPRRRTHCTANPVERVGKGGGGRERHASRRHLLVSHTLTQPSKALPSLSNKNQQELTQ